MGEWAVGSPGEALGYVDGLDAGGIKGNDDVQ